MNKREITISCKEHSQCKNSEGGSIGPQAKSRTNRYQNKGPSLGLQHTERKLQALNNSLAIVKTVPSKWEGSFNPWLFMWAVFINGSSQSSSTGCVNERCPLRVDNISE